MTIVKHDNRRSHSAPRQCVYIYVTVLTAVVLDSEDYGPTARVQHPSVMLTVDLDWKQPSGILINANQPRVRM